MEYRFDKCILLIEKNAARHEAKVHLVEAMMNDMGMKHESGKFTQTLVVVAWLIDIINAEYLRLDETSLQLIRVSEKISSIDKSKSQKFTEEFNNIDDLSLRFEKPIKTSSIAKNFGI